MTKRTLDAHVEGNKLRRKQLDYDMWTLHIYINRAVAVAIEHNFAKHAKSELFKKPLSETAKEQNGELTEEQKQLKRDELVATLLAMQKNFELNHPKE